MSVVAELAVNVVANVGKALTDLGKLRKGLGTLQSIGSKTIGVMSGVGGALTGFGAALSATALASSLKKRIDDIDAMSDAAVRLNATYTGLTTLEFAAKNVGTEFGALENALGKMQKNLGEVARTGKGPAAEAFKAIGVDVKSLVSLKTDEAFSIIADELNNVGNSAEQARLAVAMFGKSGQSILNTVKLGAEGIADYRKEIESLGASMSDEDAQRLGEFNDQLDRLGVAWAGTKTQIIITLAPGIAEILQGFNDAVAKKNALPGGVYSEPGRVNSQGHRNALWRSVYRNTPVDDFIKLMDASGVDSPAPVGVVSEHRRRGVHLPFPGWNDMGGLETAEVQRMETLKRASDAVGKIIGEGFMKQLTPNAANAGDFGRSILGGAVKARNAADWFRSSFTAAPWEWMPKVSEQKVPQSIGMNRALSADSQEGIFAMSGNRRAQEHLADVADNTEQMVTSLDQIAMTMSQVEGLAAFSIDGGP